MKKIFIGILFTTLFLAILSCNNEDDSSIASIEGTWVLTNYTVNGVSTFDPNDCEDQQKVILLNDNNGTSTSYTSNPSGSGCVVENIYAATYSIANGKLTLEIYGRTYGPLDYTVSNTTLVVIFVEGSAPEVGTYTRQ